MALSTMSESSLFRDLSIDVRFELYTHIALSDQDEIRTYDILEPNKNAPYPLTVRDPESPES